MRNYEKSRKMSKNDEKWCKHAEKWWNNDENLWKMIKKWWNIDENDEKLWKNEKMMKNKTGVRE